MFTFKLKGNQESRSKMKAAKNSIIGYSYQKLVAFYFLAIMDTKRTINSIEVEADVSHNFDDLKIITDDKEIYCQIKDYKDVEISHIVIDLEKDIVKLKSSPHRMSPYSNVIFIKNISITTNSTFMGLPSYLKDNVHVISLSRNEIRQKVEDLYSIDLSRLYSIESFFEKKFDTRELLIRINELPPIKSFSIELVDKTIEVQRIEIEQTGIVFIEGKPGVGKSHLVNNIKVNQDRAIYRFWTSSQDPQYQERLKFDSFLNNLIKDLFKTLEKRTVEEIIQKIKTDSITLIVDGFDHVENYNPLDLDKFIELFKLMESQGINIILLSRPLKTETPWQKIQISNWNRVQTTFFLETKYHIKDLSVIDSIQRITRGYPILVKFLAEQFLITNAIADLPELDSVNDYYDVITNDYRNKESLALFLSSNSFFMKSEIEELLGTYCGMLIHQILNDHPYLFEVKLNRISLIHDSLNTYLRSSLMNQANVKNIIEQITNKVYLSILEGEKKYISRYSYFDFSLEQNFNIFYKYSDINYFNEWIKNTIDIEAVQVFYENLRITLNVLNPETIPIYNYYDFTLILNIVERDHISSLNSFLYLYSKSLLSNGYSADDITSSGYLFGMILFVIEGQSSQLETVTANNFYNIENFYMELSSEIENEDKYFLTPFQKLDIEQINKVLSKKMSDLSFNTYFSDLLVKLYIHEITFTDERLLNLKKLIHKHIDHQENVMRDLKKYIIHYEQNAFFAHSILMSTSHKLKSLGVIKNNNEFLEFDLERFIKHHLKYDSYYLISVIEDYIRLALYTDRKIDISSISLAFTNYYARKDYSVHNIGKSLKLFQQTGQLTIENSVKIINGFQSKSEKGIRHILNDYIDLLTIEEFLYFINRVYSFRNDLKLNILQLSTEKINLLDENLVKEAFSDLLRNHQYNKTIEFFELKRVLASKFEHNILQALQVYSYRIKISSNDADKIPSEYQNLIVHDFNINDYSKEARSIHEKGYVTNKDYSFLIEHSWDAIKIAGYPDGNHSAFSNLELYDHFDIDYLTDTVTIIFHSALCSKIFQIDMNTNLHEMVGNIPLFLSEYTKVDVDYEKLFSSFNHFIQLSGVEFD